MRSIWPELIVCKLYRSNLIWLEPIQQQDNNNNNNQNMNQKWNRNMCTTNDEEISLTLDSLGFCVLVLFVRWIWQLICQHIKMRKEKWKNSQTRSLHHTHTHTVSHWRGNAVRMCTRMFRAFVKFRPGETYSHVSHDTSIFASRFVCVCVCWYVNAVRLDACYWLPQCDKKKLYTIP